MVIAHVLNAWLLANGVVEVHSASARDQEDVAHAPIREPLDDIVRKLHERRTSKVEFWSNERTGLPSLITPQAPHPRGG